MISVLIRALMTVITMIMTSRPDIHPREKKLRSDSTNQRQEHEDKVSQSESQDTPAPPRIKIRKKKKKKITKSFIS